jgi:hypothetical protein
LAVTAIPRALQRDLDLIRDEFGPVEIFTDAPGVVVMTLALRGVDVRVAIELSTFPAAPPLVQTDGSWEHSTLQPDGRVTDLVCLTPWNRTFGVAHLVRELNTRLLQEPPIRLPQRALASS